MTRLSVLFSHSCIRSPPPSPNSSRVLPSAAPWSSRSRAPRTSSDAGSVPDWTPGAGAAKSTSPAGKVKTCAPRAIATSREACTCCPGVDDAGTLCRGEPPEPTATAVATITTSSSSSGPIFVRWLALQQCHWQRGSAVGTGAGLFAMFIYLVPAWYSRQPRWPSWRSLSTFQFHKGRS